MDDPGQGCSRTFCGSSIDLHDPPECSGPREKYEQVQNTTGVMSSWAQCYKFETNMHAHLTGEKTSGDRKWQ